MEIKQIIKNTDFHFNKRFGQNFIDDSALLNQIAQSAEITKDDTVLEIGVGGGTLTRVLAEQAKRVVGYEIDKNLAPVLERSLSGVENCEVVFRDFMREKTENIEALLGDDFIVVANLPYYITSPITMRLLEEFPKCKRIVVMVQNEVALRFTAKPNTSDYGAITASIDALANAQYMFFVGRENFFPVPNVDSAVVRLDRYDKYSIQNHKAFKEAVRIAFLSRRKTLANNLINALKISREEADDILAQLNVDKAVRGETFSTADFIKLADLLAKRNLIK